MHILQNKHSKLSETESEELLERLNISRSQLPKIFLTDPALPENCNVGDIIKIERKLNNSGNSPSNSNETKTNEEKSGFYYRVVV